MVKYPWADRIYMISFEEKNKYIYKCKEWQLLYATFFDFLRLCVCVFTQKLHRNPICNKNLRALKWPNDIFISRKRQLTAKSDRRNYTSHHFLFAFCFSHKSNCVHFSSKLMTDKISVFIHCDNHQTRTHTPNRMTSATVVQHITIFDKKVGVFSFLSLSLPCHKLCMQFKRWSSSLHR